MANSNEDTPNTPTHNPDVRPTYIYLIYIMIYIIFVFIYKYNIFKYFTFC